MRFDVHISIVYILWCFFGGIFFAVMAEVLQCIIRLKSKYPVNSCRLNFYSGDSWIVQNKQNNEKRLGVLFSTFSLLEDRDKKMFFTEYSLVFILFFGLLDEKP